MGKVEKGKIELMQKERAKIMLKYLTTKITNGNIEEATKRMYTTKTFAYLKDIDSDFYWKSEEEILYLLQQELQGNMKAWEQQVYQ